jgi:hypothetical protein
MWEKAMRLRPLALPVLLLALNLPATALFAQQDPAPLPPASQESAPQNPSAIKRLAIEVTGGDSNKPVENASVYLKTLEQHTILKDKKSEINVKTNRNGIAHVPEPPTGRVLIQVVAEGWKTYGHWYDIADLKDTVKIHLERPPKWY